MAEVKPIGIALSLLALFGATAQAGRSVKTIYRTRQDSFRTTGNQGTTRDDKSLLAKKIRKLVAQYEKHLEQYQPSKHYRLPVQPEVDRLAKEILKIRTSAEQQRGANNEVDQLKRERDRLTTTINWFHTSYTDLGDEKETARVLNQVAEYESQRAAAEARLSALSRVEKRNQVTSNGFEEQKTEPGSQSNNEVAELVAKAASLLGPYINQYFKLSPKKLAVFLQTKNGKLEGLAKRESLSERMKQVQYAMAGGKLLDWPAKDLQEILDSQEILVQRKAVRKLADQSEAQQEAIEILKDAVAQFNRVAFGATSEAKLPPVR